MAVESVSSSQSTKRGKKAKKPKVNKDERARKARFALWAVNIDSNADGKISRTELEARIASREAAGKLHPFASKVLENLSTLDGDADDAVNLADAITFLANNFRVKEKAAKKLDAGA
jgi:hypothetical protein